MKSYLPRVASLIAFLALLSPAILSAAPPKVLKSTPADGAVGVDPKLDKLRVEFDQDMNNGGYSVCAGKDAGLEGPGAWKTKRVFECPLKLQPGRRYEWSINCPSSQNFRSAKGQAAVPFPIRFKTRAADGKEPAAPTVAEKREAVQALRAAIDDFYSYRDLRPVDWTALFHNRGPLLEESASWEAFGQAAARLLESARDVHITVKLPDGELLPTFRRQVRLNFELAQIATQVPKFKRINETVATGQFEDGIGYLLIANWTHADDLTPAFEALAEMSRAPGLVLDVRPNAGGSEPLAAEVAGRFVRKPAVYSRHSLRDPAAPGGFTRLRDRTIGPNAKREPIEMPVAVLMGPGNMSSCESFLLMMRAAPNVKLIGERSYGSSGNPQERPIGGGVSVLLPLWKDYLPDGTLLEGRGVDPDISIPPGVDDFTAHDPTLDAALGWLRKK